MDRPEFGQRVAIIGHAKKVRQYELLGKTRVEWREVIFLRPKIGIYIGFRDVRDGEWVNFQYEDQVFTPGQSHRVWLIVTDERSNPIYVFPEQVKVSEKEG